jgi:hypothetical protein
MARSKALANAESKALSKEASDLLASSAIAANEERLLKAA